MTNTTINLITLPGYKNLNPKRLYKNKEKKWSTHILSNTYRFSIMFAWYFISQQSKYVDSITHISN